MKRQPHGEPLAPMPACAFERELLRLLGRAVGRRWIAQLRRLGRIPADGFDAQSTTRRRRRA